MKRILCLALALVLMLTAALSLTVSADDGNQTLIITADGMDPVSVPVGSEFVFRIGLYGGSVKILDGQMELRYDPAYLEVVRHTAADIEGDYSMEAYCFPRSIYNANPVLNVENLGEINYNFTKAQGVAAFTDPTMLFAQFRFKAKAAGKTNITNVIQYMINVDEVRVFNNGKANVDIHPYTVFTVEKSNGRVGDADGDSMITLLDASLIQRAAAGAAEKLDPKVADLNGDSLVSLRDAIVVRKYLAGMSVTPQMGRYLFASDAA